MMNILPSTLSEFEILNHANLIIQNKIQGLFAKVLHLFFAIEYKSRLY